MALLLHSFVLATFGTTATLGPVGYRPITPGFVRHSRFDLRLTFSRLLHR
jgi:hypothetical protein